MIRLYNIVQTYPGPSGPVEALRDVDLHGPHGRMIGVIRRSSAGKSSLVRTIKCLTGPWPGACRLMAVT